MSTHRIAPLHSTSCTCIHRSGAGACQGRRWQICNGGSLAEWYKCRHKSQPFSTVFRCRSTGLR